MNKYALILAGGKGTRLWPLSRENHPKQFIDFKDGSSLFQLCLKRALSYFQVRDIFIVAGVGYKFTLYNQIDFCKDLSLKDKAALKENIIFEPCAKNTLPAILLSIKYIEKRCTQSQDCQLFVFPSDQIIEPIEQFTKAIAQGSRMANSGHIVIFGVTPNAPKEGLGYVEVGKKIDHGFKVNRFIEKPPQAVAKKLIAKGAFWNAGIFCFNKTTLLEELEKYQPKLYRSLNVPLKSFVKSFKDIESISIDYGIMQQSRAVSLVPFTLRWSDLGSWDSFLRYHSKDKSNAHIGDVVFLDSKNCFAYSDRRLTCLVGLEDVIAIDSSDSLLLVKKGKSDKIRDLVKLIDKRGDTRAKDSATVYRPWGYYTVLEDKNNYKVKEIGVYPKKAVSLQKHNRRSEHWNVVEGIIDVTVGSKIKRFKANQSVFVPRNTKHRIYNPTKTLAKIIEVQIGSYLGEDDIVRYSSYE